MEFQVPQFISRESTIAGPLTFRQFVTLAAAGLIIFILFFILRNFFLFSIAAAIIGAVALIFALLQIGGQPFPVIFKNFVLYFLKPRVYVWHHKGMPPKFTKETEKIRLVEEAGEEKRKLTMGRESQVKKLRTQLETREK